MGTDIRMVFQALQPDGAWVDVRCPFSNFDNRNYGFFGWLADVRNYSAVTPLDQPRGTPEDYITGPDPFWDDELLDCWSTSWFTTEELLAVDYDQNIEDRRYSDGRNGGLTCAPGEGEIMTLREFLGPVVDDIFRFPEFGINRVVFGFS